MTAPGEQERDERLTVGSLFSGIGGLDLGLERAGMEVRWQCEIDPYCRKVLAKHWPNVPCYEDVRELPDDIERVDLICGGYPCQPFSLAGTRGGTDDPRHLWPDFASVLGLLRPEWALLENVPGHLSLGFGTVLGDLAELGYDAEWTCIPAAAVGAPHLRWRLFVVAHASGSSIGPRSGEERAVRPGNVHEQVSVFGDGGDLVSDAERIGVRDQSVSEPGRCGATLADDDGAQGSMADARGHRWVGREGEQRTGWPPSERSEEGDLIGYGCALRDPDVQGSQGEREQSTTTRGERPTDAGWWLTEPDVGRVANGVPHRVDRLRALGNAVVPQVAELIGRRIMAHLQTSVPR